MQLFFILFTLIINLFFVQEEKGIDTATLKVKVINIPNDKGKVYVHLFKSKNDFLKKSYRKLVSSAKEGEMEFIFKNLPFQTYALSVYHDENDNGELDTYFFGLPKESYGISNDARSVFGPPSFEGSSFKLEKQVMSISVKVQ